MNRISIKTLLLAAAMLLSLTGCHSSEEEVKLRVLLDEQYETAGGDPAEDSMELELTRRLAETVGMEYELVSPEEGQSAEDVLGAGGADVALGNVVKSEALQKNFVCSVSYAARPLFIVTTRGDYRNIPAVFSAESIGLSAGLSNNARKQIQGSSGTDLRAYQTARAALNDLRGGLIEAYFCYEQEAFELALEEGIQVQDAVGVDADRFVVIAPQDGFFEKESLDRLILSYLAERGKEEENNEGSDVRTDLDGATK